MKRKTPYETLGVEKTASADEVKRAYRRKVKTVHPDAGGDAKSMEELSKAYACLSDPVRRLTYDQTGQDTETDESKRIKGLMMNAFSNALAADAEDIVEHARSEVRAKRSEILQAKIKILASQTSLKARRNRVRRRGEGENLVVVLIDHALEGCAKGLAQIKQDLAMFEQLLKALDDYTDEGEMPTWDANPIRAFAQFGYATTAT